MHRLAGGGHDAQLVDPGRRYRADPPGQGVLQDRLHKRLPAGRRELLGIADAEEMPGQIGVAGWQDHGRGHHRPGPGAAPGLVQAGHAAITTGPEALLMIQTWSRTTGVHL